MYGQTDAWRVPGYTEMRELGKGGAGRVVLARHNADDALVAIKYLSTELMSDLRFVARFRHEAHLLAAMDPNPHAARFYEYVEASQGAGIVMELIDGVSLRVMLRSQGPTGPEAALTVLKGSLLGLAAAHEIGVVHRDYKPENVMIEADGTSKLVDFGIAAQAGPTVYAAGTPPYMAPEQWAGGQAGPATDVYAATVVFFECLTGGRPFRAQNLAALARQHQVTPPPTEEVPQQLRGLIERGMAKRPADRPRSAEAFLYELESVASNAYGPAWEDKGQRRLAALAALLLPYFPMTEEAPEAGTDVAETRLGGLLGKAGMKIGLSLVAMAVLAGGAIALVGSVTGTTLQAGSTVATAPPADPATEDPGTDVTQNDAPPTENAPSRTTPMPSPTTTAPVAPATSAPATTPPSTRPSPTPRPARPYIRPTRRPTPRPTSEPSDLPNAPVDNPAYPQTPGNPSPTPRQTPTSRPTPTVSATPSPDQPTPTPTSSSPETPNHSGSPQ